MFSAILNEKTAEELRLTSKGGGGKQMKIIE